jgi:DNA-binding MarR family transcriptional regulator/GNAT superfamily N-acetyltransferase
LTASSIFVSIVAEEAIPMTSPRAKSEGMPAVAAVRRFSRVYTRQLGLLDEHLLASEFSLTEVRVLFELAHRDGLAAADLVRDLGLDAGYLSRILRRFGAAGLVRRSRARDDARRSVLTLSARGRAAFAPLERTSSEQVAALLERMHPDEQRDLVASMARIERALTSSAPGAQGAVPITLRHHRVGDIGWIAHRQGLLYAQEYGWDQSFEALVAEIGARFVREFDPKSERCWIAEQGGHIVGSVFVVRKSARIAQLRLLYVEPSARGQGIGQRLVGECIAFARTNGYRKLSLWTNDVLDAARHIYAAAGFVLVKKERHRSFGKSLVGQHWDLTL